MRQVPQYGITVFTSFPRCALKLPRHVLVRHTPRNLIQCALVSVQLLHAYRANRKVDTFSCSLGSKGGCTRVMWVRLRRSRPRETAIATRKIGASASHSLLDNNGSIFATMPPLSVTAELRRNPVKAPSVKVHRRRFRGPALAAEARRLTLCQHLPSCRFRRMEVRTRKNAEPRVVPSARRDAALGGSQS